MLSLAQPVQQNKFPRHRTSTRLIRHQALVAVLALTVVAHTPVVAQESAPSYAQYQRH